MSLEAPEVNKAIRVFYRKGKELRSCLGMFIYYKPKIKNELKGKARFCRKTEYGKYEADPEKWSSATEWEYL